MWRFEHKICTTFALMTLVSLVGMAPVDARSEAMRERPEHQPSSAAHREAGTRQRSSYAARAEAPYAHQRLVANDHRQLVHRGISEPRPAAVNGMGAAHLASGARVHEVSRVLAGGQVHVVRYGNTLSGTYERTIRPGLMSRTFVSGGRVLYAHVYQRHVWHQFGRAFAYETFVPAVRFPGAYYAWTLAAWPRPISYSWGWQGQPWYPTYGAQFTPYPVYSRPDLWMTDYIIAESMQSAYQAQTVAPVSLPASQPAQQVAPAAPAPDSSVALPAAQFTDATPPPQPTAAPSALPPAITPQVKAQLNAQIKVQLQEQQAAAAMPASLTTQSTPPALRSNHTFFQVVQPIVVPSGTSNGHCTLSPNDYIKRTGAMSNDDWMIPVVVELSRPSDCPEGLPTRIGLNDLNAMENEQEAQVMAALQAASKSMGQNGPPSGAGAQPTLVADGNAAPDPMALDAIRHTE